MDENDKIKENEQEVPNVPEEEKPPILGSWRNLYIFVIGFLLVQILVYWLLTQYLQ